LTDSSFFCAAYGRKTVKEEEEREKEQKYKV